MNDEMNSNVAKMIYSTLYNQTDKLGDINREIRMISNEK